VSCSKSANWQSIAGITTWKRRASRPRSKARKSSGWKNDEAQFALDRYQVEQNEAMSKYKLEQELDRDRQRIQLQAAPPSSLC
jgi:hypothetical protein